MIYLVIDKFGYGVILKGAYSREKDALKVRRRVAQEYIKTAEKRLKDGLKRYNTNNEYRKSRGLAPMERWNWIDLSPEEYAINNYTEIVKVEIDEPIEDIILYME